MARRVLRGRSRVAGALPTEGNPTTGVMMVATIELLWNEDHMNGPIVVGTDGSQTAAAAVRAATTLAKTFGQPLHVVCSYRSPPAADGFALTAGVTVPITD